MNLKRIISVCLIITGLNWIAVCHPLIFSFIVITWFVLLTMTIFKMYLLLDSRLDFLEHRDKVVKDDLVKVNGYCTFFNDEVKKNVISHKTIKKQITDLTTSIKKVNHNKEK